MTRFLSESLQAREPSFRTGIRRLEQANGNPSHDIRLTAEVIHGSLAQIHALGLDPHNSTAKEIYQALLNHLKQDDAKLVRLLRTKAASYVSAEADVMAGMALVLKQTPIHTQSYALKTACFKSLIKKQPPKKAMKALNYRSIDSMLKHESTASVLAAAALVEAPAWHKLLLDKYKKLSAKDFEAKQLTVSYLDSQKWRSLAATTVAQRQHNLMSFPELASLVLLPLPAEPPAGLITVSLSLSLHALNELRAAGTYLRLNQVRADFGSLVQMIARSEPILQARLLDQPLSWHVVQRYYSRAKHLFATELFEPHLQVEDMSWHSVEKVLTHIEPSFGFWQPGALIGKVVDGMPLSFNVLDNALNVCNQRSFEQRTTHYFQHSLWHELIMRYLKPEVLEQTILQELQPQLAFAPALV
jgi:hypothetical protein